MIIREMAERDLDEVVDIENELFTDAWKLDYFLHELRENDLSHYYVMEDDGVIIGYGGLWILFENCDITNVAITKKRQGEGLGMLLLNHLLNKAYEEGCEYVHLEVRVSNRNAISLYERNGFAITRTRKGYYSDNHEDAYDMIKCIVGGLK